MRAIAATSLRLVAAVAGVAASAGATAGQQAGAPEARTDVSFDTLPERQPPAR